MEDLQKCGQTMDDYRWMTEPSHMFAAEESNVSQMGTWVEGPEIVKVNSPGDLKNEALDY